MNAAKMATILALFFMFDWLPLLGSEQETTVSWPLAENDGTVLKAKPEKYKLTRKLEFLQGGATGCAASYLPELDMRNRGWTLSGFFTCSEKDKKPTIPIVGTRHECSSYTGWDLFLINGCLRFFASGNSGKSAVTTTRERYDDGKEHFFRIGWFPDGGSGKMTMSVDGRNYSAAGVGDLGENRERLFAVGCQLGKTGKRLLGWKGSLKEFSMIINRPPATVSAEGGEAGKLDPEMKSSGTEDKPQVSDVVWCDIAKDRPDLLRGQGWSTPTMGYRRLPERFKETVPSAVWSLSGHSAGVYLHFRIIGGKLLAARWKLTKNVYLPHMSPLGVNGLDLYVKVKNKWLWARSARPHRTNTENYADRFFTYKKGLNPEFLLYLPLYTGTTQLELGISPGASLENVTDNGPPLVFYGTSITHGCSASRPGMPYPAILGRRLDLPVINLGFSGNGKMDIELAAVLAEITASAYVIDCVPNMTSMPLEEITGRTLEFVKALREARPNTPVILVEDRDYAYPSLTGAAKNFPRWAALDKAYRQLLPQSPDKLFYVKGETLLTGDNEATVDGSHPTDLGMFRYAEAMEPILRQALGE